MFARATCLHHATQHTGNATAVPLSHASALQLSTRLTIGKAKPITRLTGHAQRHGQSEGR
eukprot:scaffold30306_cov22-Tisochrysis_lutea.AAC.1